MNKFFFLISWRNFTKKSIFSYVNIIGFSIGLTVFILISLLIINEYSFDRSFEKRKDIYRINSKFTKFEKGTIFCTTGNIVGPALKEQIPDIDKAVRTFCSSGVIKKDNDVFRIKKLCWADEDFFNLFETRFYDGSPESCLSAPNSLAISENMAKQIFKENEDIIGKTLLIDNIQNFQITAIFKDFPENSSFGGYQIILPYKYSYKTWLNEPLHWANINYETFCLLKENTDANITEKKMNEILKRENGDDWYYEIQLQPFNKIHLHSLNYEHSYLDSPGSIDEVKISILLSVIILLIASFNYMNLSTARSQKRSKEMGISKILGAKRSQLIKNMFIETAIMTFIAFIIALFLTYFSLPVFNTLFEENIQWNVILHPFSIAGCFILFTLIVLLSASYPALYLSSFSPLSAIRKTRSKSGLIHSSIRKILIISQFAISIILVIWVIIINSQIRFMSNKDLGYNTNNLVAISLFSLQQKQNFDGLINDYKSQSSVLKVAFTNAFPVRQGGGNWLYKTSDFQERIVFTTTSGSSDLIDLLEIKLIAGHTFSERKENDSITYVVVNKKTIDYLGIQLEDAIGSKIYTNGLDPEEPEATICGVFENFHFRSLHYPIELAGIHNAKIPKPILLLKIKPENLEKQLKLYEEIFKKHFPNDLFDVRFPDIELQNSYKEDHKMNRIILSFSFLAIFIASIGVFGLSAYMTEQRKKEIGIRKVLGAKTHGIFSLFNYEFLKLLFISLIPSLPIALWIGMNYLNNFAYHISISWWMVLIAILINILFTLTAVSTIVIKSARENPVNSIRNE